MHLAVNNKRSLSFCTTFCDNTEILFFFLSFTLYTSLIPVREIYFILPISSFFALYGPNSLECYDKSELSNQSSDDKLSPCLQFSLHPSRLHNLFAQTHVTYCTGSEDATKQRQKEIKRERDILPSRLKIKFLFKRIFFLPAGSNPMTYIKLNYIPTSEPLMNRSQCKSSAS